MTAWDRERWRKLYLREPLEQEALPWYTRGLRDLLIRRAEDDGFLARTTAGLRDALRGDALFDESVEQLIDDGFLAETSTGVYVRNLPTAQGDATADEVLEDEPAPENETKEGRRRRLGRARARKLRASRGRRDGSVTPSVTGSVTERDEEAPFPSPLASPLPLPSQPDNQTEREEPRTSVTGSVTERDARSVTTSVTRRDQMAASFVAPHPEDIWTFEQWQQAFGKTGAEFSGRRCVALLERRRAGMTRQDAIDALAGAKADSWVNGTKDGTPHDGVPAIFGDADRYEGFRDAGRAARAAATPAPVRRPPDIETNYTPPVPPPIPDFVLARMAPKRATAPALSREDQLEALRLADAEDQASGGQPEGKAVANDG